MTGALQQTPPLPPAQRRWLRPGTGAAGLLVLLAIILPCFITLPWSIARYDMQDFGGADVQPSRAPSSGEPLGTDQLGRSMLWRCLLGGAISLGIGLAAALISVVIGVGWGMAAGLLGGHTDAALMRIVDVLYGLPYILLVVLVDLAMKPAVQRFAGWFLAADKAAGLADVVTLLIAIGGVSWLTLSRVIRGQVLSLRAQPFIEAARAYGAGSFRIAWRHLLPNLVGPIVVYTTLTVPSAILQESLLSFLGIGVQAPLPSWGNLAAAGVEELATLGVPGTRVRWWLLVWPCLLLGLTLLSLNFLGDALRDRLDPRRLR